MQEKKVLLKQVLLKQVPATSEKTSNARKVGRQRTTDSGSQNCAARQWQSAKDPKRTYLDR